MKPLAIDLFCGVGGWTKDFLANGYDVIGFDIKKFKQYPGHLIIQDCRTVDGRRLKGATVIVASPPCEGFTRWMMRQWFPNTERPDLSLVEAAYRIAKEAGCPIVLENVRGAIPFLGRWKHRYASFYLWGDVPVLMPSLSRLAKIKSRHRASHLRAEIPFELAFWVAEVMKGRAR